MKEYQAHSPTQGSVVGVTPKEAAKEFFRRFPSARKCNIIEGVKDGNFFTVKYTVGSLPYSVKDVTKKQVDGLPDTEPS